jgi:hypothetical protein
MPNQNKTFADFHIPGGGFKNIKENKKRRGNDNFHTKPLKDLLPHFHNTWAMQK